jgi:hypothetical protein
MAGIAKERRLPPALPLATLIGRELRAGGSERPSLRYGHAGFAKRGEDYFLVKPDCLRVPGDTSTAFSVFAVSFLFLDLLLHFIHSFIHYSSSSCHALDPSVFACLLRLRCSTATTGSRRRSTARSICSSTS